ncbi:MAG: hypothetical protein GWN00_20410, partial [Aliifodinibius sp.]|nr:hypothetical protein [Fodinibius sp.]NIV13368.1 hypothetical protein [Fodinibius sp.]NIY27085.1 hypothetical protein [Fodinibius sp.]
MKADAAWKATLGELELQMTKATFNTWLKDARLLACDEQEYIVGVRNDYAKDWLENRLEDTITRTLSAITAMPIEVRFVVLADAISTQSFSDSSQTDPPEQTSQNKVAPTEEVALTNVNGTTPNGTFSASHFQNRYSFSTFVVGTSNRLAHAA